ncbi:MAG: sigma 54-interacting transcriptional regulator [Rhodoferax sp.]|uniref:sigma-54 interaction domain-containing protein n=1 Tax=Rhodoferax sp. TaxID=50421 RepID=UPI00273562F8|nr:sigma 54-interacting transcriptional regulator [Rhodoferax sp.]MDP2677698.1 sigma 54-interacting transcriptional regulator [Rhodoferax sp.]
MIPNPSAPHSAATPPLQAQEQLLMREIIGLIGKSLAPGVVLREMLHLLSELLGLNRGRIVLVDAPDSTQNSPPGTSRICFAYGLTNAEMARGLYAPGEGITGRVLATGQTMLVQDIDAEPQFLARAVTRDQLPQETVAFIALPIHVNGATVGVLACHRIRSRQRRLTDDMALLKIMATLAGQVLQLQDLMQQQTRALETRNTLLTHALDAAAVRYGIIGTSSALLQAIDELERVAQAQASVLLLGESGTGKELFARALHLSSQRRDAPFIKVNCAAIPETLFESELFGYERGAFTGAASARVGWFEQANHGTIFLDEIGDMPVVMQSKLLRTLQEGTIVRLGGKSEIKVDVRLVAATHRNLEADVASGNFRRDLFYRLNVIPIRLPSLRERREDIHTLAIHFMNRANQANQRNVYLSSAALSRLEEHPWPGNIRELGNVIERLVLLADGPMVTATELERFLQVETGPTFTALIPAPRVASTPANPPSPAAPLVRDYLPANSHTLDELQQTLARYGGNQSRAAQALGMTVRQFAYRLRKGEPQR